MEENHSYEQVIGSSAMPYFNSLVRSYGVAVNYDANSHYSIPNYFWLSAGAYLTTSDGTTQKFDVDNVTRYLMSAGKTWKAYEESLPYQGYTGPSTGAYGENHDPFSYFTDVVNSTQKMDLVPFTQLASDIANGALPNFGFITPNEINDGHNGNLSVVDQWLQTNLASLLASPHFRPAAMAFSLLLLTNRLTPIAVRLPVVRRCRKTKAEAESPPWSLAPWPGEDINRQSSISIPAC